MAREDAPGLDRQLCFPLYAAARQVTGRYTPFLKPLGLTYTQYLVMLVLWERDGVSIGEICQRLLLDSGTLSPLLKKLEQAGFIHKARSQTDDRVVQIRLTEAGKALQLKAKDVPLQVAHCIELPPEKAETLYRLLYELLEGQTDTQIQVEGETKA